MLLRAISAMLPVDQDDLEAAIDEGGICNAKGDICNMRMGSEVTAAEFLTNGLYAWCWRHLQEHQLCLGLGPAVDLSDREDWSRYWNLSKSGRLTKNEVLRAIMRTFGVGSLDKTRLQEMQRKLDSIWAARNAEQVRAKGHVDVGGVQIEEFGIVGGLGDLIEEAFSLEPGGQGLHPTLPSEAAAAELASIRALMPGRGRHLGRRGRPGKKPAPAEPAGAAATNLSSSSSAQAPPPPALLVPSEIFPTEVEMPRLPAFALGVNGLRDFMGGDGGRSRPPPSFTALSSSPATAAAATSSLSPCGLTQHPPTPAGGPFLDLREIEPVAPPSVSSDSASSASDEDTGGTGGAQSDSNFAPPDHLLDSLQQPFALGADFEMPPSPDEGPSECILTMPRRSRSSSDVAPSESQYDPEPRNLVGEDPLEAIEGLERAVFQWTTTRETVISL
eukprot:TRINITY_DN87032_c0_g1_i1.p1 TRINITY_DN87032_c0_g1~~TRINITY_DN87032_c0_g1_i1.p1  ORF type:complete len:445 (-),score=93.69 TRINITY_DN87032_c0_g1_i1:73-1407(-)